MVNVERVRNTAHNVTKDGLVDYAIFHLLMKPNNQISTIIMVRIMVRYYHAATSHLKKMAHRWSEIDPVEKIPRKI